MTKWSKLDTTWKGVSVDTLLESVETEAEYLTAWSDGGYTTNVALEDVTDGKAWVSEGWWNLKPSDCDTLVQGPLAAEFYYVYAMDERGGEWKGKAYMCTNDREFKIDGREDCFARGYERTGFFEVDTGKDAKNWTVQLTDPAR